ncbi:MULTISPECIES: leukocidin family pore-forming toxin [Bacillus cereus group]|uniref:leukocidin family pore-forming toxin n=1 Tax=Bacillus cereus group TaxID=86661 RepID=UPI000D95034B|nr:leukocidin family pore-forming toxin [Bacillus cereus]SPT76319.1 cytotoxin K [Bacillus cereus]
MNNKNSIFKKMILSSFGAYTCFALLSPTSLADTKTMNPVDIGEGAKVHQNLSTKHDTLNKMKTSLEVSIINDPNNNKQIAVIKTDGSFLNANKQIIRHPYDGHEDGYMTADLKWASSYGIKMELLDQKAKFHKASPINTVDKKTITSTVGYNIGGDIQMTDGKGAGGTTWSTSASYEQPDYKTVLENDTADTVQWKVPFVSAMNQGYGPYTRDSSDLTWGNQLFMKKRTGSWATKDNFISSDGMPALASYGFSPGVIAVVVADKSEKTSNLKVTYTRTSDDYQLRWMKTMNVKPWFLPSGIVDEHWIGSNAKDTSTSTSINNYTIDWENHRLIENIK